MNSPLFEVYMVKRHILSNGMVVVHESVDHIQSVALNVWIKVGSIKEHEKNNGVSHFIEHMIFKGSDRYSAKDIAYIMDGFGSEINAYTSKEVTCVYTKFLGKYMDETLDVLGEMLFNPSFNEDEIENEIEIILDEIDMYDDSPEDLVYDILTEDLFKGSTLSRPILGTKDTISIMDRKTILDFYNRFYQPENMVISIVGNFDEKTMIESLEKTFGKKSSKFEPLPDSTEMEHYNFVYRKKDIEQVHVNVSFKGVPYATEAYFPFVLMNAILGGNTSSKLFQTIREEHGLTYSIYSHTSFYHNHGLLNITFSLNPKNLMKAVELIGGVLKEFKEGKIKLEAFEHGKSQMTNSYILGLEHPENLVESYGKYQLFLSKLYSQEGTFKRIESIEYQAVLDLAKNLLNAETMAMSVVGSIDMEEGHRCYLALKEILEV